MSCGKANKKLACLLPLLLLICSLLMACATSPKANFYTLSAALTTEQLCAVEGKALLLKTELNHFPDLLEQPQIATRPHPNRIEYAEFHRWAGDLEDNFQQGLGQNLEQLCGRVQVVADSWPTGSVADYLLYLNVIRFDGKLDGSVTLSVDWLLKNQQENVAPITRQSNIVEPVGGNSYAGLVAAQSRAVASLARELLQSLRGAEGE